MVKILACILAASQLVKADLDELEEATSLLSLRKQSQAGSDRALAVANTSAVTCSCTMTADNDIDYVYINGKDVTKTISQYNNLGNWPTNKVLTFECDKYTTMAVQASDGNTGATAGCRGGGFGMKCTASDTSSPWHNYESDKTWKVLGSRCKTNPCKYGGSGDDKNTFDQMPANWFAMDFDDSNWKTADQGNSIATRTGAKMSICSNDGPGWLLRMPAFAVKLPVFDGLATCQCTMTADNDIDYVYIDGEDVTKTISQYNNLGNWPTNKVLTFGCDKYTTMAVQASDGNTGATAGCKGGGFGMKCTSTDTSSPWHNYESDKSWKVLGSRCKTNPCKYGGSGDDKNTFDLMPANWFAKDFDDSNWKTADQGNSIATRTGAKMSICSNDGPGWLLRMPAFAVKPQAAPAVSLPCKPCEKIKELEEKVKELLKMENKVDEFKQLQDEVNSLKELHGEMDEFKQLAGEVEELKHLHGDVEQLKEDISDIKDEIKNLAQPAQPAAPMGGPPGGYYR